MKKQTMKNPKSLLSRILISYLLLTFIPISALYALTTTYWWHSSKQSSIEYSEEILHYFKDFINSQLVQMERLSGLVYSDRELLYAMDSGLNELVEWDRIRINKSLDKLFYDMSYSRPDIYNLYFFDAEGAMFYYNPTSSFGKPIINSQFHEDWFKKTLAADGKAVFISSPLPIHDEQKSVFSMSRLFKSNSGPLGIIVIDFTFDVLHSMINDSSFGKKGKLIISDFEGNIILQNGVSGKENKLDAPLKNLIKDKQSGSQTIEIANQNYLLTYDTFDRYSIKLIHLMPVSYLISENLMFMLELNLAIFVLVAVLMGLSIYYFRRRLSPLKRLAVTMDKSITEPFDSQVEVETCDEIGILGMSFNNMMINLQELFQKDYKNKIQLVETEKAMLEAQINPHFLYNTLDTIRFKAIEQGNDDVAKMLYYLSTNLRYTIDNKRPYVTVHEAVQWLERYIFLQKLRFGQRFEVFFQIDISIYDMNIHRLFLQPFIENAIIHGFKNTKTGGLLHINGYLDKKETLCFEIVDNGGGFDEEIELIVTVETVKQLSQQKIGMYNAIARLFLYYGDRCQVYIHSIPNKTTAVRTMIDIQDGGVPDAHIINR